MWNWFFSSTCTFFSSQLFLTLISVSLLFTSTCLSCWENSCWTPRSLFIPKRFWESIMTSPRSLKSQCYNILRERGDVVLCSRTHCEFVLSSSIHVMIVCFTLSTSVCVCLCTTLCQYLQSITDSYRVNELVWHLNPPPCCPSALILSICLILRADAM